MNNFLKANWIAITVCLACAAVSTGGAFFFVKKSAQESHAAALKMAEELQSAGASLEKANAETAKAKESWNKEKALNEDLKKMVAEADLELEKLRMSVKSLTTNVSKVSKTKIAKAPASAASPECPSTESKFSKHKIKALQNLQADVHRRDRELKERQKRLDEAMETVAREKRKLTLQNSEYRWPHDSEQAKK